MEKTHMRAASGKGGARVETDKYIFEIRPGELIARLDIKDTHQRYMFFAGGACNAPGRPDETLEPGEWGVTENRADGTVTVSSAEKSSLWEEKRNYFVCRADSLEFYYTVRGKGFVDRAHFFRGYHKGAEYGFAGEFDEIYSTCPNFQERLYYHPADKFSISWGNDLSASVGGQALASPCHCAGLRDRRDRIFVSAGLAAEPGRWTWDAFEWNPPVSIPPTGFDPDNLLAGGFAAVFSGAEKVDGEWRSPKLILTLARGEKNVLRSYLGHCYSHGYMRKPEKIRRFAWWSSPIYCTWHDQTSLSLGEAMNCRGNTGPESGSLCTQELVERWLGLLIKHDCKPGIVILDAVWQKHLNTHEPDPDKWPDFRGWVESCHGRGIRVFLWTAAWSPQGLPADECVTRDGVPVTCDITNPKYEKRFREMVRRWFSAEPGCLNADGVKVDGLLSLPTGPNLKSHGDLRGLELQSRYLEVLYGEAKKCGPDKCVSTFVANPRLSAFSDMVRIADMYTCRLTAHRTMLRRAEVYKQTMPYAVVDTDGQFAHYMPDGFIDELGEQALIGVPSLYNAELVRRHRFFLPARLDKFSAEDYKKISKIFSCK